MARDSPPQVGHHHVKDSFVSGDFHVVSHRVREPQIVVGDAGTHSLSGGLVPPVKDVAFFELVSSGPEQVFTGRGSHRNGERHDVLELITETEGATGLIDR